MRFQKQIHPSACRLTALLTLLLVSSAPTLGEPSLSEHNNDVTLDESSNEQVTSSDEARAATIALLEEMIDILKSTGDGESQLQARILREQILEDCNIGECMTIGVASLKAAQRFQKENLLLTSRKVMKHVLVVADAVQSEWPHFYVGAHHTMASLEIDFENYDKALEHAVIASQAAENNETISRRVSIACRNSQAAALERLGRFPEAERIQLQLLEEAKDSPDVSRDDLLNLKFALANGYARNAEHGKYLALIPREDSDLYDEKGEFVAERAF